MVIVASGMVRWRVRLATTFGTQPTASSLQQSTVFAEEKVWKIFLSALFRAFWRKNVLPTSFQAFLEGHKHKAECRVHFSFVKELLS